MSQAIHSATVGIVRDDRSRAASDQTYQAHQILNVGSAVAPILVGADEFFHLVAG